MIKRIDFITYKKLKNISLEFSNTINVISGTNGTCKSSLLYLISNSFQSVSSKASIIKDIKGLKVLNAVNNGINTKYEKLTRGDKQYNDPAIGLKGKLFSITYFDDTQLGFRRHNSRTKGDKERFRYSIKPLYPNGSNQKLPEIPVLYLGLSRLIPYGEYGRDDEVKSIKDSIPSEFYEKVAESYSQFTHHQIKNTKYQHMGSLKNRADFITDKKGIDSNTISAGEDNLFVILTALESLKNYYKNINSDKQIESILLVDEVDASLHPAFQIKLLHKMRKYATDYKIQIFMTTHSLSLIKEVLRLKENLVYLVDNEQSVTMLSEPTIEKIEAHLRTLTVDDIYKDKKIPILTEDNEARLLLKRMFDYFEKYKKEFKGISNFFAIPDINIGCNILKGLFKEQKLINSRLGAICVLDGDNTKSVNINDCIIALPGKSVGVLKEDLSPENLLFAYSEYIYEKDESFWQAQDVIEIGFSRAFYNEKIKAPIDKRKNTDNNSDKNRDFNKNLFRENKLFFDYIFSHWLNNADNAEYINCFYNNLKLAFRKVASIRGINPLEWK